MTDPILIYGATGFTGRLIVSEAARRGVNAILAGRNEAAVRSLAEARQLPCRVFSLDSPEALLRGLEGVRTVLHCAGPFTATAPQMLHACLASKVHYTDITGEIPVLLHAFEKRSEAAHRGITVIPGCGFDVVPTDCLALALKQLLPTATRLRLAFQAPFHQSPGTFKATVNAIPKGGMARIDGQLLPVPHAWKLERIPYDHGKYWSMSITWGDLVSAYESTGIPNIDVFIGNPLLSTVLLRLIRRPVSWLASRMRVARFLERHAGRLASGPDAAARAGNRVHLRGDAWDGGGRQETLFLIVPEAYALTAQTAVDVALRVASGQVQPGVFTPAQAFGSSFINRFSPSAGCFNASLSKG